MQGKRTAAKRSKLTTVAWVALVAFLTFYIIFQLNGNFSPELTVETATAATERLSRAYSGYILRNEVVLTSFSFLFFYHRDFSDAVIEKAVDDVFGDDLAADHDGDGRRAGNGGGCGNSALGCF